MVFDKHTVLFTRFAISADVVINLPTIIWTRINPPTSTLSLKGGEGRVRGTGPPILFQEDE
jgi:hypothetical protein